MSRILVVDDEAGIRRSLKLLLERDGHEVAVAPDGSAGLERFCRESYDLVITDHQTPGLTGCELLQEIRRGGSDVPVILMSGAIRQDHVEAAVHLGANFLQKPVRRVSLRRAIDEIHTSPAAGPKPSFVGANSDAVVVVPVC